MCHVAQYGHLLVAFGYLGLAVLLGSVSLTRSKEDDVLTASACYGNINYYLRMTCPDEEEIVVLRVIYGVKVSSSDCESPASHETYQKKCCHPEPSDCQFDMPMNNVAPCLGHPKCDVVAGWDQTQKHCDQDEFKGVSTYMLTHYKCKTSTRFTDRKVEGTDQGKVTSTLATYRTTQPPRIDVTVMPMTTSTASDAISTSSATNASSNNATTESSNRTAALPARVTGSHRHNGPDKLSNTVIGAIVGGSIGMLLTFVAFIFYWGRKRRLRIIEKPEPSVWDYLLSQTFTVRGSRGYDHFSSTRSSASSEGDAVSPVVRKNVWLPNISPQEDNASDVISNYDNDTTHRLEIHQSASPEPYAFLSLGVPNTQTNRNHQDA